MHDTPKIEAGEGYRLLSVGEVTAEGDEYWSGNRGPWVECRESWELNITLEPQFYPHRRKVEIQYRALEIGETIEAGDEMWSWNQGPWVPALANNIGTEIHLGHVKHRRKIQPQYRALEIGEDIEAGDEWFESVQKDWVLRSSINKGEKYNPTPAGIHTPHRRKIQLDSNPSKTQSPSV